MKGGWDCPQSALLGERLAELGVALAHSLHERAVHAQNDEHLQLRIVEQRVALGEDVTGAAEGALSWSKRAAELWAKTYDAGEELSIAQACARGRCGVIEPVHE